MSLVFLLWFAPSRTRMVKKDEDIALVIKVRGVPTQEYSKQKKIPFGIIQTPRVIRTHKIPKNQPIKKVIVKRRTF